MLFRSKGHFIAIEAKAGNNMTTALQDREILAIQTAGGVAFVVNEDNIDLVSLHIRWGKTLPT